MNQTQSTQRFDQCQLRWVKVVKLVIAVGQLGNLSLALVALTGEHHPQVLDRWSLPAIIQIDHVQALVAPQQITHMQIAVHPQGTAGVLGKAFGHDL